MNYKMIVLDLDDTLLKNDGTISKRTKEKLVKAQKNGVKVVLASGRPTYAIEKIATELELQKNGGYIISYNGARIIDCANNKELYSANITNEQIHELYDMSMQAGAYIQTYMGDYIIASESNEYTDIEKEITGMDIIVPSDFKEYVTGDVVKAIVLQKPERLKEIEELWKTVINARMYMTISKPFFLEFMNNEVDKSKSIKRLSELLGISMSEVIAIGDSYNDLSMIKAAGLGVAMANAVDCVKKVANYITDDNEHDGVAKVIEKFVFKNGQKTVVA